MKTIISFIGACILLLSFPLQAQQSAAWLQGRVLDQMAQPLPGVQVIYEKQRGTLTDTDGFFHLQSTAGVHTIRFRLLGFQWVEQQMHLASGDTIYVEVRLKPEVYEMDQVVVTASRMEQRLAELTVSMSVIKPEEIAGQHITNAKELIDQVPGVEVLDGQASVRGGSGYSYGAGSRVLALVDGLPVVAADAGNIRWQYLPLHNLSQVEVIKGASSVAYGSSALNGVIHFRTADAGMEPKTTAFAEVGLYDHPRRKAWQWNNKPVWFSSAGFSHLRKMGNTDIGISGSGTYNPGYRKYNEDHFAYLNLKLKHFDQKKQGLIYGLNLHGGLNEKTDFVLWDNAETGALIQDTSTAILLKGTFLTIDPFISYRKTDDSGHDLRMRFQRSHNLFPEAENNNSEARNLYAEYQIRQKLSPVLQLHAGLSQNSSWVLSPFYGNHNSFNLGLFSQVELSTGDRLKMVAGMRMEYNRLDGVDEGFVPLFRAGINYQLFEYSFLRASFGQGYRVPSIAERYATTRLGSVRLYPNKKLMPESGWNAEAGLRQGFRAAAFKGQLDVAFFYMQNQNLIEYELRFFPDGQPGSYAPGFRAVNVEASRVYGFELEGLLSGHTKSIKHNVSGSYVFLVPAEVDPHTGQNTGEMLKYRRRHSGQLHWQLAFRHVFGGLRLTARSRLLRIDPVFLNERTREQLLPGFYDYWQQANKGHALLDLQLGYRLGDRYTFTLMVKNLTNHEYLGRPGDIQPQRSYDLRFQARF